MGPRPGALGQKHMENASHGLFPGSALGCPGNNANESILLRGEGRVSRFLGNSGVAGLEKRRETEFSFLWACARSLHFRWCWGWGTCYDTRQKILEKWPPGTPPPPDPRASLMRAGLWKREVGPLPAAAAAAPLATAATGGRRLPPRQRPTRGPRGRGHRRGPHGAGPAATHAGESGPAAGETPAPHRALFGFPWRLFPAGLFVFLQITDAGKTA